MLQKELFSDEQIRSTSEVDGVTLSLKNYQVKTLIIENGLNQSVSIQCKASAHEDMSKVITVGSSFSVSADTNTYQTCDSSFPFFSVSATCSTAPTLGGLTVYLVGVRAV